MTYKKLESALIKNGWKLYKRYDTYKKGKIEITLYDKFYLIDFPGCFRINSYRQSKVINDCLICNFYGVKWEVAL